MGKLSTKCSPEILSLYLDNELVGEDYSRVEGHIRECQSCRKELENIRSLSRQYNEIMNNQAIPLTSHSIENPVLDRIRRHEIPLFEKLKSILSLKKILIPATGMCIIVVLFMLFLQPVNRGPTAIVKSVSGDVSSIYILETPETRQTILWFNERVERETS